jgi:nucleoside 2-deoxyribosyltransferase
MPLASEDPKVFVALPFNERFTEVYEDAVCPAITEAGLAPLRVDELVGHENIIDDIENGIREALLVFADVTTSNPNVFYEIGFARATGKPLVVATQDDHVPFDLRPRRFIKYELTGRGLRALREKLVAWFVKAAQRAKEDNKGLKVHCHGTKFDVPNRNAFWNDLLGQAQRRFYLLGRSNKSWISKSEPQRIELAKAIVRIVSSGGTVRILSAGSDEIVQAHRRFFRNYVLKLLDGRPKSELETLRSSLKYVVL